MAFVDPLAQDFLEQLAAAGPPPDDLAAQRAGFSELWQSLSPEPPPVARAEARQIGGVDCLVYWPDADEAPLPVTLFCHGGGGVMLTPEDFDPTSRMLANQAQSVVVVPRYRQAPEHPFPAPLDDCFTVYRSLVEDSGQIDGDGSRIAVSGDSAGGYLAAAVAQDAKRQGVKLPVAQVLIYPMLDMASAAPSRFDRANFTTHDALVATIELHFGDAVLDPRASPLREPDLDGLPPALIIATDTDCLIDEARAYAHRLRAAGVDTSYFVYEGQLHGFFSFGGAMPEGNRCVTHVAGWLRDSFARAPAA
ncbi:alpha/beta hydrolase [Parasphingopyxis algicola]|uniref:alpha/beta hydrolase n=1 Tax=Parasphingopyxis algicola TaxID=2026624 RepID=UPI0015A0488F|nr:alpha/beta hydrolase [Parasphingopyxis algicola]QLC26508.1 alpha/beta hydrolase [Parasphingopyxis algicola]